MSTRSYPHQLPSLWKTLGCCSIVANALCSGGIFTFPLMSPVIAERCRLSQTQLTTIVLAAMMGQYPFAALAGKMIDRHGPSRCSITAAILYVIAFGSFSYQVNSTSAQLIPHSSTFAASLTISFGLAGLATVFSYFSFLFAASRLFPQNPGVASGTSMALFGLSPLFLTSVASTWYINQETGSLQVVRFTAHLAMVTGIIHIFGAMAFNNAGCNSKDNPQHLQCSENTTERSQLLSREDDVVFVPELHTKTDTTLGFLSDGYLWLIILFCICVFGASEMVISNIGTIVAALPSPTREAIITTPRVVDNTAQQVRLISLANTLTRILVGPLADFISPIAMYLPNGTLIRARKHRISRITFLCCSASVLALTFLWTSFGIVTQDGLWVLSLGTGLGYSATFTVIPSIVSSTWGSKNLGRNFGILMYAPFVGNPLFSYFYAFVSQAHVRGEGICRGRECWQATFHATTATSLLALAISIYIWRQWRTVL